MPTCLFTTPPAGDQRLVAGSAAARTAGLPETLHVRLAGDAIATGKLIGDLGLI
jgi:hypothetical protein